MKEADKHKTAFCTPVGLYKFNYLPMGLKHALATFQRTMDMLLAGLLDVSCLVYIDDIIVSARH